MCLSYYLAQVAQSFKRSKKRTKIKPIRWDRVIRLDGNMSPDDVKEFKEKWNKDKTTAKIRWCPCNDKLGVIEFNRMSVANLNETVGKVHEDVGTDGVVIKNAKLKFKESPKRFKITNERPVVNASYNRKGEIVVAVIDAGIVKKGYDLEKYI